MGLQPGINITSIKQPEQGGIIAIHCPLCKATDFILSLWAVKPRDGDFFYMPQTCINDLRHDLEMCSSLYKEKRFWGQI